MAPQVFIMKYVGVILPDRKLFTMTEAADSETTIDNRPSEMRLAILTDRTRLSPGWTLAQALGPAITGGADLVIFTEPGLPKSQKRVLAKFALDGVKERCPMVVWDDTELALAISAAGVHCSSIGGVADARVALGSEAIVGATVASLDEVAAAKQAGATYLLAAFNWSNPETSLALLQRYAAATALPVLAALDMPIDVAAKCLSAGAEGVVICEPAMAAYDRTAAVAEYVGAIGLGE